MCPQQPTLGSVCRGATLSLTSTLDPQLPSHQLLVPPAPPWAARTQQRRKSSQLNLQLLSATGGGGDKSFGLGYLQAAQRKEEKTYSSTMGQATHPPCQPRDPGLKDHHEARRVGRLVWVPRHQYPRSQPNLRARSRRGGGATPPGCLPLWGTPPLPSQLHAEACREEVRW